MQMWPGMPREKEVWREADEEKTLLLLWHGEPALGRHTDSWKAREVALECPP